MNVGEYLDTAAENLANALALARRPAADTDEQLTVAVARTRLYRALHHQLVLIAGPEQLWEPGTAQLSQILRGLTANVDTAMPDGLPTVTASGPAGTSLHEAAQALTAANNLLDAHIGDRSTPRSPEGVVLAAGHRQPDNLVAVGRLAGAAMELDECLRANRWLHPSLPDGRRKDLLLAVNHDLHGEPPADSMRSADDIAAAGNERFAFARELAPLPPIHNPALWTTVTSARQAVAAIDAARFFVFHHGDRLTAPEMAAITEASRAITTHLIDVMMQTGTPAKDLASMREWAQAQWNHAAAAAGILRIDPRASVPATPLASTALRAVAVWLGARLRAESEAVNDRSECPGGGRPTAALRHLAGQIAVRLSDVAQRLRSVAVTAQREHRIYYPVALSLGDGRTMRAGRWLPAPARHDNVNALIGSLQQARRPLVAVAGIANVRMLPGVKEVELARAQLRDTRGAAEQSTTRPPATAATASRPTSRSVRATPHPSAGPSAGSSERSSGDR